MSLARAALSPLKRVTSLVRAALSPLKRATSLMRAAPKRARRRERVNCPILRTTGVGRRAFFGAG